MKPILFSGSSHPELAKEVAELLGLPLGRVLQTFFPDGETSIQILEKVRGASVFLFQSCVYRPNDFLMELLLMIDAVRRGGAAEIIPVLPYFPYCRQDRIDQPGEPIAARIVAEMIERAGATQVIAVDLHQGQLEGFFKIPFFHARAAPTLFRKYLNEVLGDFPLFVAPDAGSIKVARQFAALFKSDFVVVDKFRPNEGGVEMKLIGDVRNKNVVITDDLTSTGLTLAESAKLCKKEGAELIFGAVTHCLLDDEGWKKVDQAPLEKLLVSSTIPLRGKVSPKASVVSVAPLLASSILEIIQK